jgi:alkylation response protein AidB-like acyl-CoA dehydrogenase
VVDGSARRSVQGYGSGVNLDLTDDERSFREEARTWLREHLPTEPRPPEGDEMRAFDLAWQRTLFDGGWAGINWPA